MKKFALVLSGGGFKGAFQVGALKYLKENWDKINPDNGTMKFDIVTGVSVGSLNGFLIATNKFADLETLWNDVAQNGVNEIYNSDIIDTKPDQGNSDPKLKMKLSWEAIKNRFPNALKNVAWRLLFNRNALMTGLEEDFSNFKSIADNSPLAKKLSTIAKKSDIKDCIYKCGYVSLNDGSYNSCKHSDFTTDVDFANGILASTTMPIIWKPVEKINTIRGQSKYAVDGGIRNVSPLGDAISEIVKDPSGEEYLIIIINCSSGKIEPDDYEHKNIAQIALRSLDDIAITEIFNNDLAEFIDKNFILKQINDVLPDKKIYDYDYANRRAGKVLKRFNAIIIQPADEKILGDSLVANDVLIERRLDHGQQKAEEAILQFMEEGNNFNFVIV